jgi:hypothetical protein
MGNEITKGSTKNRAERRSEKTQYINGGQKIQEECLLETIKINREGRIIRRPILLETCMMN